MRPANAQPLLKLGPFVLDLRAGEIRKNVTRIRLQEKPLRVLALLAEQQGQIVTREELKKHLWPEDTFVDFDTGLNTAVKKLRGALSDDAETPHYIETIPRRGYRFICPVEIVPSDGHATAPHAVSSQAIEDAAFSQQNAETLFKKEPRKRPFARMLLLSALGLLALGGVGFWFFESRAALSLDSQDSVLIADFENQTGDPRFDTALGTAFVVSIEQSRYANVFPRTRIDSTLTRMGRPAGERITPALGREISQRENVRGLLACSITRTGREYALTAQLINPQTGATVRSYTEHSYGEDHILEALDVLSKEIREALGESLYQIHKDNKPLPEVTTKSLSALQQFADGSALWNRGKYMDAVTLFKAAIASDPDFAMAHAALGNADYSYIFNLPEDGQKEYEKALSLESRTTDRERMIIETHYAQDQKHVDEAEGLFRAYLNQYPDDSVMRFAYANLLRSSGINRQADAIDQYNQVHRLAPDFAQAYIGMATALRNLGKYPDALQAYSKAFEIDPKWLTSGNVGREYGFTLVANGEGAKAEKVFTDFLAKPETRESGLRSLAFLDLYYGRYASAQTRLEQSLEILRGQKSPLSEGRVHLLLATVAEGRGDAKRQRQNLDAALVNLNDIQVKPVFGAFLGDAYARAGFADQAEKIAAIIKPLAGPHNSEQMGYLYLLEGDIALSAGQRDKAIELLKLSDKENKTGLSSEALAHAYQQSGDLDNVITSYQRILDDRYSLLSWEPQHRWLEAHLVLAAAYLSRGEKQKARETLAAFLALWKDADPDLPVLKQAKAEYAKLQ